MKDLFEFFGNTAESVNYWHHKPGTTKPRSFYNFKTIPLPEQYDLNISLADALRSRRSHSETSFDPSQSIDLARLAKILWYGISKKQARPFPSGGGLYPVEVYVIAKNVSDLESGFYYYNKDEHYLVPTEKINSWTIYRDAVPVPYVHDAAAVIIFSYRKGPSWAKYGNQSIKLALLEAGHICQNIQLIATETEIETRPIGSNTLVNFSKPLRCSRNEVPFYGVCLGN